MSRPSHSPLWAAVAAAWLALLAGRAGAQGPGPVGAGAGPPARRDAPEAAPRAASAGGRVGADAVDPLALLLAARDSVGLTARQAARIAAIRAQRDSVVGPMRALADSLALAGDPSDWRRLTEAQRVVLRGQVQRRSRVVVAVREREQQARELAYAELNPLQRARADQLETAARRAADDSLRRSTNGGWAGMRGQRPW